ncbi:MAG TPA: hypothetical protein VJ912_00990 [Candidatus Nanoarchaeia archaeon]|nr:hypothetical protein [Candidatus Nanoarchaeia archaeon]
MGESNKNRKWKTHLVLHFGTSNTKKPSQIAKELNKVGFNSFLGTVDFVYTWKEKKPSKEEVLELADKVSEILKSTGSVFNLDTHD